LAAMKAVFGQCQMQANPARMAHSV